MNISKWPELNYLLQAYTTKQLYLFRQNLVLGMDKWFSRDDVFPVSAVINRELLSRNQPINYFNTEEELNEWATQHGYNV